MLYCMPLSFGSLLKHGMFVHLCISSTVMHCDWCGVAVFVDSLECVIRYWFCVEILIGSCGDCLLVTKPMASD